MRLLAASVSLAGVFGGSAWPQDAPLRPTLRQAAGLMAVFGPPAVDALRANETVAIAPSALSAKRQSVAAELMLSRYASEKARYAGWSDALQWGEAGADLGVAAALLYAGPQAAVTIPATLGYAVLSTGLKVAREEVDAHALAENRKLLAFYAEKIETELGLGYDEIRALAREDPDAAMGRFMAGTEILKDLRNRAAGDPELERVAVGIMIDTIANTTAAQMAEAAERDARVEDLEDKAISFARDLKELDRKTDERLDLAEGAIARLDESVETLSAAVVDLDDRVTRLETDQAVVVDFIFNQMSAADKVKRLEAGFMSGRFRCEPPAESCEASELKDSLIARYKAEAQHAEVLRDLGAVAGAMNDVSTIAGNLGIDLPDEVDMAIGVANVAVAAMSASTGLGAVAAVSGLVGMFGGGKGDPDAARHRQLMAYLDRRFDAIDARLEDIIENQARIMQAIVGLSEQMQDGFERMDRTLARMEYEQAIMSDGVRSLIWTPWKSCYATYSEAMQTDRRTGRHIHIDPVTKLFRSENNIRAVIAATADVSALPCLEVMQPALAGNLEPRIFENFTDLRWVIDNSRLEDATPRSVATTQDDDPAAPEANAPEWRSLLMRFDQEVFKPSRERARAFVQEKLDGRMADAYVLLARPVSTVGDWKSAVQAIRATPLTCQPGRAHADERLCRVLSPSGSGRQRSLDEQATHLLARPILGRIVLDVREWVIVMAQIADRREQGEGRWVYVDEHLAAMIAGGPAPGARNGERLIEGAIDMLDIAIASYAMTYGPMPARAAADDFLAGRDLDTLIRNFEENDYLAHNATLFILEDLHRGMQGSAVPPEIVYRRYYDYAKEDILGPFIFLETLFGSRMGFSLTDEGEPGFLIQGDASKTVVSLPTPDALVSRRIKMPPVFDELVAARADLVDRLFSYQMLDELDPESLEAAALALMR